MNLTKTSSKRRLLFVILAVIAFSATFIFNSSLKSPVHNSMAPIAVLPATLSKSVEVTFGFPVRLKIPTINVDAALDNVGVTPEGDLDVPKNAVNAAWYDHGPRPGEEGASIISGHFGYENNTPAVFDNLHTLQKGDSIYIVDERGMTLTFVVRELSTYKQNEEHSDVFRSSDGKAHLNLITCQGAWNRELKSYSDRLVVFSDEVVQELSSAD